MMNRHTTLARIALALALAAPLGACSVWRGQQSMSEYGGDTAITSDIKAKYAADRDVAATSIRVETLNGVVQLSGFAKNQTEKERAAEIAKQARGVKSVRNDIVVRP